MQLPSSPTFAVAHLYQLRPYFSLRSCSIRSRLCHVTDTAILKFVRTPPSDHYQPHLYPSRTTLETFIRKSMLDYEDSPPPLNHSPSPSDRSHFTSRDTTPVTPVGNGPFSGRKSEKDFVPWFRKPIDVGRTTTRLCLDIESSVLAPDFDDNSFPTFGASPPHQGMASVAKPFDITARQTSTSPRGNQPSNLTSALQGTENPEKRKMANSTPDTAFNRPIPPNAFRLFRRFRHFRTWCAPDFGQGDGKRQSQTGKRGTEP